MVEIKQIPYKEWLKQNPTVVKDHECAECQGSGKCACFECGQERDCPECDGEGHHAFTVYENQRKQDIAMAERAGCLRVV